MTSAAGAAAVWEAGGRLEALEDTERVAKALADVALPGDVIFLRGDVGAGKVSTVGCCACEHALAQELVALAVACIRDLPPTPHTHVSIAHSTPIRSLAQHQSTFARALLRRACADAAMHVPSPTYTLRNDYDAADGRALAHFDLYRLDSGGAGGVGSSVVEGGGHGSEVRAHHQASGCEPASGM